MIEIFLSRFPSNRYSLRLQFVPFLRVRLPNHNSFVRDRSARQQLGALAASYLAVFSARGPVQVAIPRRCLSNSPVHVSVRLTCKRLQRDCVSHSLVLACLARVSQRIKSSQVVFDHRSSSSHDQRHLALAVPLQLPH